MVAVPGNIIWFFFYLIRDALFNNSFSSIPFNFSAMSCTDLETGLGDLRIFSIKLNLPGWGWAPHQDFVSHINPCLPTPHKIFGAVLEAAVVLLIQIACWSSPTVSEALGQSPTSASGNLPSVELCQEWPAAVCQPLLPVMLPHQLSVHRILLPMGPLLKRGSASPLPPSCVCAWFWVFLPNYSSFSDHKHKYNLEE